MNKVFISYSWKDEAITLRLYRDLKRLNISIWLDRIDGELTGDFKQEFLRLIDECDYFIVIDSHNYRHNSNWCETELKTFFKRKDRGDNVSLIVCQVDPSGQWKDIESINDIKKRVLLERLNSQKYIDFTHEGIYDNDRVYLNALETICHILGKESYSWDIFPEEADILDELDRELKENRKLVDVDRDALIFSIKAIICRRNQNRDITKHSLQLINDCNELGVELFVPKWIYAIWLADNRHLGRYDTECLNILKELCERFPKESRAYRGLGGIAARLNQLELSEKSYLKVYDLINQTQNNVLYEVCCNLGQVYMNMRQYAKAKDVMRKALILFEDDCLNNDLMIKYFECLMHLNSKHDAGEFVLNIAHKYPLNHDALRLCGYYYLDCNLYSKSVEYFKRAYSISSSMENAYGMLCAWYNNHDVFKYKNFLSTILTKSPVTSDDEFWKKQIYDLPKI